MSDNESQYENEHILRELERIDRVYARGVTEPVDQAQPADVYDLVRRTMPKMSINELRSLQQMVGRALTDRTDADAGTGDRPTGVIEIEDDEEVP